MDERREPLGKTKHAAIEPSADVERALRILMVRLGCHQQDARETMIAMACAKGENVEDVAAGLLVEG